MSKSKAPLWNPPVRPQWLTTMNREGSYLNLPAVVPLDEALAAVDSNRIVSAPTALALLWIARNRARLEQVWA